MNFQTAAMQRNQPHIRLRPDLPAFSEHVLNRALPLSTIPIPMAVTEDEKRVIKEALMNELDQWMKRNNLKQVEAAHILGVAPPRVSDAINKKTLKFTVDALIDLLAKTGKHVHLSIL